MKITKKYSLLSIFSLSIPIILSTNCSLITRKEETIKKEIFSNLDTYSLYDEQIIFKQDNSPKNIITKEIDNNFFKQEIVPDKKIQSNIIHFKRWNAFPFDFDEKVSYDSYQTIKEFSPYKIVYSNIGDERGKREKEIENVFWYFKKYMQSYKDNFLFDFKNNLFQGNVKEFQSKFDEFKKHFPSLDYKKRPFNFDNFEDFKHYDFYKDVDKYSKEHSFELTKKYLFFTGTNLSNKSEDIFYWMPYIKNNKLYFSRVIKNERFCSDSGYYMDFDLIRTINLKTWIFDIQKIKELLNLSPQEEFIFEKHIEIENNIYYQNFSEKYKKNMIWTMNDLFEKNRYSWSKKEKKIAKEIIIKIKYWPKMIPY